MAKSNKELLNKLKNAPATQSTRPVTVADQVKNWLEKHKGDLVAALPKHVTADRMARVALTTIRTNPKLLECSIDSLLAAVMQSAQLGLEPGILGHVYFVPFRNNKANKTEVQFIIGYKGLLELVARSGAVRKIDAQLVYESDEFDVEFGFDLKCKHLPNFDCDRNARSVRLAYAIGETKDGLRILEVMNRSQIDAIRGRSKAKDSGPWVSDYEEMARKTVLRRLCKRLPLSIEDQERVQQDVQREYVEVEARDINLEAIPPQESDIELDQEQPPTETENQVDETVKPETHEYTDEQLQSELDY